MKIFLAGATGVLGRRLLPQLIWRGHVVVATTTSPSKVESLRRAGATPVVLNAFDRKAVSRAVEAAAPDVVVHELTALSQMRSFKNLDKELKVTNRLRTEATANLLTAARSAGARRFVAQSYTGWPNDPEGSRVKAESDPLVKNPPRNMRQSLKAIQQLESMVTEAPGMDGMILRYGSFYGPGTFLAEDGEMVRQVSQGKIPIVGSGEGIWSFIHIDDAATATATAIESHQTGIFNVVDDEPAEVSVWLPELARAIGGPKPRHVPAWLARFAIGEPGVYIMTRAAGSSNWKAKHLLNWRPEYSSWRQGFQTGLTAEAVPV